MRWMIYGRVALVVACVLFLPGCASSSPANEPDSPALPIDPHPAQPGTFTNRTDHPTLSD